MTTRTIFATFHTRACTERLLVLPLQPSVPVVRSAAAPLSETRTTVQAWPSLGDAAVPHRKKGAAPSGPAPSTSDDVGALQTDDLPVLLVHAHLRRQRHPSDKSLLISASIHSYLSFE